VSIVQLNSLGAAESVHSLMRPMHMKWHGRQISVSRFVSEYAASIDLFRGEVTQTLARFHQLPKWQLHRELETRAVMRTVVMIVFDSAAIGDRTRELLLAQVLSEMRALWSQNKPMCSSEFAALLARATGYYALRDRGNQIITGVRIVKSYLDAMGLTPLHRASVPERYLSTHFACRILADIHRIGVAAQYERGGRRALERWSVKPPGEREFADTHV
jgi:hypothetical protein